MRGFTMPTTVIGSPCHWVDESGVHQWATLVALDTQSRLAAVKVGEEVKGNVPEGSGSTPLTWHFTHLDPRG